MRIESKLCHVSENKIVVQVTGWNNDKSLGSALAEGPTVEFAEDKAISRLTKRIYDEKNNDAINVTKNEEQIKTPLNVQLPKNKNTEDSNSSRQPNDWSDELTKIDAEIERLKWSRNDEIYFIQKNFGYNHRNKITNYSEIVKYLNLLRELDINDESKVVHRTTISLIQESDRILNDLSWDHIQGREYLQKEFNVSTRKELNEKQLISFVEKLQSIRKKYLSK